jgi:nucleotide-binding universal stress UspA family protein
VPTPAPTVIDRILVPLDGSEPSFAALDFAATLAGALSAKLDVVTVVDLGQLDFYDGMYHTPEQVDAIQTRVKQDVLDQARHRVPEAVDATFEVLHGPVVRTLLSRIAHEGVDLVVLGRTGKGAIERLFEGSVSRQLTGLSPVPVTVVG